MADLNDDQRAQLDGIVQKMHDNHETDAYIQSVVDDFKTKNLPVRSIADRNAEARANMAKQANAGGSPSEWSPSAIADRAVQGAKGEAIGAAGALAAPAVMLYQAVRHPIDTATAVGGGAMLAGEGIKDAVTMPGETTSALKDAVLKFAADPENVGGAAGAIAGGEAVGPLFRAARMTRIGQAVNRAAEGVPVAGPVVKVLSPSLDTLEGDFSKAMTRRDTKAAADAAHAARVNPAPAVVKIVKPTAKEAAKAAEDARLSTAGVVPPADAAAANPNIAAPPGRPSVGFAPGPKEFSDPNAAVKGDVVPTADAVASRMSARMRELTRQPYTDIPAPPEADAVRSQLLPVADVAGSNPDVAAAERPLPVVGAREPGRVTSLDQQLGLDPALFRSGAADVAAPAPGARLSSLIKPEPTRYVDQPMFRQQQALEEFGTPGTDARSPHLPAGASTGDHVLNTAVPADFHVVDPDAEVTQVNGSGESAASKEALSRQAGMKARGEQFAVRRGGSTRVLAGPDAVDYNPQPGEQFGIIDKDGQFRLLSLGEAREKLIGSRGAGHMSKASREALFNALMKRVGTK